jgi:hypothetical protein
LYCWAAAWPLKVAATTTAPIIESIVFMDLGGQ